VVDGSLRQHHSVRGILTVAYRQRYSGSILRHIVVGLAISGAVGPIRRFVEAALADGIIAGAVSAGLAAVLITAGTALVVSVRVWSLVGRSDGVDIYDMTAVNVNDSDCELTIQYEDGDGDDCESTTVEAYDEDELDEAVEILRLKGAPIVD